MRSLAFIVVALAFLDFTTLSALVCDGYFQYDEVEHLNTEKDMVWMSQMENKKNITAEEMKILDLLASNFDRQLSDTALFTNIERLGFNRRQIGRDKFPSLDKIFCTRRHRQINVYECLPVYRDILIFKKQNKTVGFARVCFSCDQAIIVGTTKDTQHFGQSGDFERLAELLK